MEKNWFTLKQACEYMNYSTATLYNLVKAGKIKNYSPIKKMLIKKEDLDLWISGEKKAETPTVKKELPEWISVTDLEKNVFSMNYRWIYRLLEEYPQIKRIERNSGLNPYKDGRHKKTMIYLPHIYEVLGLSLDKDITQLITAREGAKMANMHPNSIRQYANKGLIKSYGSRKWGKVFFYLPELIKEKTKEQV